MDRLVQCDRRSALEHLSGSPLLAEGAVTLISVEAVRDKAGPRWDRKRDDVASYVQRKLEEHLAPHDLSFQISDTEFLIAATAETPAAGRALCLKVLQDVLVHFLGAAELGDMNLRTVDSIAGDELACTRLDPARIARAPKAAAEPSPPTDVIARPRQTARLDPVVERQKNPVSFRGVTGRRLKVAFSTTPIRNLRQEAIAAIRIGVSIIDEDENVVLGAHGLSQLNDDDIAQIDRATLEFAALFLEQAVGDFGGGLIAPVSFRTAATRKGRQGMIQACAEAPSAPCLLVLEMSGVDHGTPGGRIAEVLGLVGGLCRAVFVRPPLERRTLEHLRGVGFQGVCLEVGPLITEPAPSAQRLLQLGALLQGLAPVKVALGLPSEPLAKVAQTAGFTHAGDPPASALDAAA
ncbi:hypothetical protein Q0812_12615 [Brevundimonas sp. 2R-24]|uniref:EAL domain-containing protein n=1 Tax=Peiella sedimenti TaxID=3061083 RepID=A0ABT8SRN3_9CAUL|nr:hypothetical protein [Caulobacteraceae bacterium XZ-24]